MTAIVLNLIAKAPSGLRVCMGHSANQMPKAQQDDIVVLREFGFVV